jgi:hypothetical protein
MKVWLMEYHSLWPNSWQAPEQGKFTGRGTSLEWKHANRQVVIALSPVDGPLKIRLWLGPSTLDLPTGEGFILKIKSRSHVGLLAAANCLIVDPWALKYFFENALRRTMETLSSRFSMLNELTSCPSILSGYANFMRTARSCSSAYCGHQGYRLD